MSNIKIPPAALEAGARAIQDMRYATHLYGSDDISRAAFVAMVEAWPGKDIVGYGPPFYGIDLILPLMEKPDDEGGEVMRWIDCPKNPLMSCGREDCIEGGCRLIMPRAQEPWPSPNYIPALAQ